MAAWTVAPSRLSGRWSGFRQVGPGWAPLYHAAGSRRPTQPAGRWHTEGGGYAQYLALTPAGAWAECVRNLGLRSTEHAHHTRRDLWLVSVSATDIADLGTFDRYQACGLDPAIAVDDAHERARALADALLADGYHGVISPSAALPGVTNLTIFGERYERVLTHLPVADWDNPDPSFWCGVQLLAEMASPPHALCVETRFLGEPHHGLAEWRRRGADPAG